MRIPNPLDELKRQAWETRDYVEYVTLHGAHEAFDALGEVVRNGTPTDEQYWTLVAWVWNASDGSYASLDTWREYFTAGRPGRSVLMTPDEHAKLAAMPETIEVYRGFGRPEGVDGIAWTLRKQYATHFATYVVHSKRYAWLGIPQPTGSWIATAQVPHDRIVAYFDTGEDEVIVLDMEGVEIAVEEAHLPPTR